MHPDDFTPLAKLTDTLWVAVFASSIVLAFRSEISFRIAFIFALGVGFLMVADPRGVGSLLQIPVHIVLCLISIGCLAGWIE